MKGSFVLPSEKEKDLSFARAKALTVRFRNMSGTGEVSHSSSSAPSANGSAHVKDAEEAKANDDCKDSRRGYVYPIRRICRRAHDYIQKLLCATCLSRVCSLGSLDISFAFYVLLYKCTSIFLCIDIDVRGDRSFDHRDDERPL